MANSSTNKVIVGKTKIFKLLANVEKTLVFQPQINLVNITNMTTNDVYFRADDEIAVVGSDECNYLNSALLAVNTIYPSRYNEISFIAGLDSTIQIFNPRYDLK